MSEKRLVCQPYRYSEFPLWVVDPRVKDDNPLGTQKTVSMDFDEDYAHESRQENFNISKLITLN